MRSIFLLVVLTVGLFVHNTIQQQGEDENKEAYLKLFEQYDSDHDGFITMDENLEQDRILAEEQGRPFDEDQSVSSFEKADLDKDGKVSFEEMSVPKSPDEHCKELFGEFSEFDGAQSCRCMRSYAADVNGTCVEGSHEVCISQFGPDSEFDGMNTCTCKNGTIPDVNGTCIKGSDSACKSQFGSLAVFDIQNSTCACEKGALPDMNSTCILGSTELCQEWYGPNTAFDGINSCVCKKGFVYADGECFRGSNKVCSSITAGSKFDGVNSCKCRNGYEKDEARGMCIKTNASKSTASSTVAMPSEGTVTVAVLEAKHLPKMDTHTKCDPFTVVKLGLQSRKTKVVKKTYTPQWHETFRMSYDELSAPPHDLEVEVYDWDAVGSGRELIGRVSISLGDVLTEGDLQGWFDIQGPDGGLVRGHDGNSSAVHVAVRLQAGPPRVPWWEARPAWILASARAAMAAWGLLGLGIWVRESRIGRPKLD